MLRRMTVQQACAALANGDLVVVPTETVYGLAANAANEDAVARVYEAKRRPQDHPLILHIHEREQADELAVVSPVARLLMDAFWPGALTIILAAKPSTPSFALGRTGTVALRSPAHDIFASILRTVSFPLAAPSANSFGRVSPTRADDVEDFSSHIAGVVDGGPSLFGVESTIIDARDEPVCVRPGGIALERIEAVLGQKLGSHTTLRAPGTHASHYAPHHARVWAMDSWDAAQAKLRERRADNNAGLLGLISVGTEFADSSDDAADDVRFFSSAEALAHELFALFRSYDKRGFTDVICVLPSATGIGLAVRDRMLRAAAGSRG